MNHGQPESFPELPPDPSAQSGNLAHVQVEFLEEGRRQLAGNLARVAEHGPEGVAAYMGDLLKDEAGDAPAAERAAALDMLGEAQKLQLGTELEARTDETLQTLRRTDETWQTGMTQPMSMLRAGSHGMNELAPRLAGIGRGNLPSDPRAFGRIMEAGAEPVGRFGVGGTQLGEQHDKWSHSQLARLRELTAASDTTGRHARAIDTAVESLASEDVAAKDLSPLIKPEVAKLFAAEYLKQRNERADQPDADEQALQATAAVFSRNRLQHTLESNAAFTKNYLALINTSQRIQSATQTVSQTAQLFRRDAGTRPQGAGQAVELARYQSRRLDELDKAGRAAAETARQTREASQRHIDARSRAS